MVRRSPCWLNSSTNSATRSSSSPGVDRVRNAHVLDELTGRAGAAVVSMAPLDRDELAALAEPTGVTLLADTIDGVHALSAGNPFFALQLLGHLADDPSLEFPAAACRSASASGSSTGSTGSATGYSRHWRPLR